MLTDWSATVIFSNGAGFHMRPAVALIRLARRFKSDITLEDNGHTVDAKSLMGILMLVGKFGSKVSVLAKGIDASHAVQAIKNRFTPAGPGHSAFTALASLPSCNSHSDDG
jgi:phosphocarrier protein HPr